MPNQQGAPVPQDVHPQQYQAAGVGAPPGPQWGVPGPGSMPQGPAPPGPAHDWNRRLAEIQQPQPQPQPPNPYDQRETIRAPLPQRQLSPRQEQLRQYQEPHRHTPGRRSPPLPNVNHPGPSSYPGQQGLPQPLAPPVPQPPAPNRITNPNYGTLPAGVGPPLSANHGGPGSIPFGRRNSSPPEIRPIAEDRVPSPGPSYPHSHHYHPAPPSQPGGIAAGAPPPVAALAAAEAAARGEIAERTHSGFKRMHESDDDYKGMHKIPANGETRSRMDDHIYRRQSSPPDRKPTPRQRPSPPRGRQPPSPIRHPRDSSEVRREEQRRADENYHPSEAAHHPPTLPSMHQQPQPQVQAQEHLPPISDTGRDERNREAYESAARKMDVDEDYDDEGEDEKRLGGSGGRNSPQRSMMNGPTKIEAQA